MFPKTWKRKKTQANRQYRRKSQELLAGLKPGMREDDVTPDDLTAGHFQKSISRKRLYKYGTVTLAEKVKAKLEKRAEIAGRKVQTKRATAAWARSTLKTLNALQGARFAEVARRAGALCHLSTAERWKITSSQDPVDRALCFLHRISYGSAHEILALRRNPELQKGLVAWINKAEKATAPKERTQMRNRANREPRTGH